MAAEVTTKIDEASKHRLAVTLHNLSQVETNVLRDGPVMLAEVTRVLEAKVAEEYKKTIMHPEESTGATLKTLKSEAHGLGGAVEIAGGAPYREFGTEAHMVEPHNANALHWTEGGQDFFSKGHMVSGVPAEDFVGRAIEATDAEAIMLSVFERSFLDVFTEDI